MSFNYIKFNDYGHIDDELIYVGKEEPTDYVCKIMNLQKREESGTWFTNLTKINTGKAELVFVVPYREEVVGRFTVKTNTYIFKVENEPDAYIE